MGDQEKSIDNNYGMFLFMVFFRCLSFWGRKGRTETIRHRLPQSKFGLKFFVEDLSAGQHH